ncbi:ABC transporter ATP-binding protein [Tessaracoccus sp. OH4464_COT-324]|uniref:ATP-binding cassette domain-containing protein n=1 Tax=Tessaracoccus sp. OH4464_COT-324 TaxID=2491059 RepID=UPI000F637308|nr:ABC transporter ATP-binding protein [Tessaracoccus sp. OH4464_COT-324]RRD45680.1 ABC transporter ATP-binding protein [Tessaracoccus sp. OH4464_COT-324]
MTTPVAQVCDLTVRFGDVTALDSLCLTINPGERVGIIGESGSGKSMTASALLGLLPVTATVTGSVQLQGVEIVGLPEKRLRRLRGQAVGLVAQDPRTALNPLVTVGDQVAEPLRAKGISAPEARRQAVELLGKVQLPDPKSTARRYPGALSGGQRQRVGIALALAANPALLIADEPTSALDTTVQAGVLEVLAGLSAATALMFITHDIAVAALLCSRLVVLRRGVKVADGPTTAIVDDPPHEYVCDLLRASSATALPAACASLQRLTKGLT